MANRGNEAKRAGCMGNVPSLSLSGMLHSSNNPLMHFSIVLPLPSPPRWHPEVMLLCFAMVFSS